MKEPKINEAHYTLLFKDVDISITSVLSTEFYERFDSQLEGQGFDEPSNRLYDVLLNKYRYYEINSTEDCVFQESIMDVFEQHLDYYLKLAEAYYKDFDFATANKRTVHREDTGHSETSGNTSSTDNSETDTYGLPNKQVNGLKDGYLTNVDKTNGSNSSESSREGDTSLESTITTTFDNEYLDLKRQYVRQLRNLILEFVDKFDECFLHVYS